jgi:hypothetical protein
MPQKKARKIKLSRASPILGRTPCAPRRLDSDATAAADFVSDAGKQGNSIVDGADSGPPTRIGRMIPLLRLCSPSAHTMPRRVGRK